MCLSATEVYVFLSLTICSTRPVPFHKSHWKRICIPWIAIMQRRLIFFFFLFCCMWIRKERKKLLWTSTSEPNIVELDKAEGWYGVAELENKQKHKTVQQIFSAEIEKKYTASRNGSLLNCLLYDANNKVKYVDEHGSFGKLFFVQTALNLYKRQRSRWTKTT